MIKKNVTVGVLLLMLLTFVVSCEKDFREIGGNVIENNKFNTKQIILDIEIEPLDVNAVRADNIGAVRAVNGSFLQNINEYPLGVYKTEYYKTIKASIVSQLAFVSGLTTVDNDDTDGKLENYHLDAVILKIPYRYSVSTDSGNKFELDSVLGDETGDLELKVYQSRNYLKDNSSLNASLPNSYLSNHEYETLLDEDILNDVSLDFDFKYGLNPNDTVYEFKRELYNGDPIEDSGFIYNEDSNGNAPFLAIPLNIEKMKTLFWDKFQDAEFSNESEFVDYFWGLVIQSGESDAIIPVDFSYQDVSSNPSIEFHYNVLVTDNDSDDDNTIETDTIYSKYSFPLLGSSTTVGRGIVNSYYETEVATNSIPDDSFVIQGTAGTMAKITILNGNQLDSLRQENLLINDAALIFNVNESISTTDLPQRLYLYKEDVEADDDRNTENNGNDDYNKIKGVHILDSYREASFFGGGLEYDGDQPTKYTIRITDYISELLKGEIEQVSPLLLKVYNGPTDDPVVLNNALDSIVKSYNWNPRGVTLLNHLKKNGEKRAKLVISYTEEK